MNKEIIYLDHAAATPMDLRVITAMEPYFRDDFYNPSSPYAPAVKVRRDYEEAKHLLASSIGAKPGEIIMTAGATESINLAFNEIGGHVIVANIEHHAVLNCAKLHDHTIVESDSRGFVSADVIKAAIRPDTKLVSVALANNELGTVQPLRDIAQVVRQEREARLMRGDKTPIYLHSDASQGVSQLDVNIARLGVDMLTLNSGKMYGPKQMGLLWAASHVRLNPLIVGGGQERGLRSGTENVAGTIGFARALELATTHRKFESERLAKLRDSLQTALTNAFTDAIVSGHPKHRLAGHLHISFPGLDGERLIFILENRGVLVSTGSACAANKGTRSHVLMAIGMTPEIADGSIRITLGHLSTPENTGLAGNIIIEELKKEYYRISK
ncbi:aminotransferase [Candidatus Saccharibacteria bacterium CG11_big_fil_rev_8_21_14_0_20_41_19]|nr:cysteine desulfurase [Candidatus Saccharibacteria bacterium]OIP86085.1 MAG: aminotransferase [Candidatus Saccharibacteria bacterium CG2_30_41_52]PIQ70611.1 MAG: aminotransferase [Candidatus Saccharibacteria bacterium CG11_big_fil_rev_8_21_14_0_20_41_19]PIZ60569.1 MAG: aminotransferase [Candidatus Saccharibacteria bacterium CG_4_10_14_0_2_um_filter_41_11]PJC29795.1 MAG: aminotransferase [Candidatus Saccharibacteria bacterium CG_4_9_14_0_2_um_filter_41_9]PJE66167.1 MAG: aminotransferase [Cand